MLREELRVAWWVWTTVVPKVDLKGQNLVVQSEKLKAASWATMKDYLRVGWKVEKWDFLKADRSGHWLVVRRVS